MNAADKILNRGVAEIINRDHLANALGSGKKLRVKFGIDPTAPKLHLGHTVVLRKLRQFQDDGHKAVLIIGDFTAQIGDPSGRSETRKPLTEKEIKQNLKNYLEEAAQVIDVKKTEIHYNNEWFKKGGLLKLLEIAKGVSEQQVREREDFQKREKEGSPISVLEILYPLLQGYDSVAVRADVELGGTDQKFNLLMGRRVQRHFGLPEQDILTVPLIEGTDGVRKMSKSFGNYIALKDSPENMFGKIMAVPDNLIGKYFELLTDVDPPENLDAYKNKLFLAQTIVEMYHSKKTAQKARENFLRTFSKKEMPKDIPEIRIMNYELSVLSLLLQTGTKSKSEARRLVEQGALRINGIQRRNPNETIALKNGDVVQIGPRKFYRIKF